MANCASAKKRIRQTAKRREANRYYAKTTRNLVRDIRASHDKKEAQEKLPTAFSQLDRLVKRGLIHKNKAANLKSELAVHVNKM